MISDDDYVHNYYKSSDSENYIGRGRGSAEFPMFLEEKSGRFDSSRPNVSNCNGRETFSSKVTTNPDSEPAGPVDTTFFFGHNSGSAVFGALNVLSLACRIAADKWYFHPVSGERLHINDGEQFALMHSEITEAFEGVRKNKMDIHLPHRKAVEVELADALIRIFNYAGEKKLDLTGAVKEKLAYNESRADHTVAARTASDGKKC